MEEEQSKEWGYRIGPSAELLKEIGQIMVNYSECERAIYSVFRNIMSLDQGDTYLLVKHANLNAEKMSAIIRAKIDQVKPSSLIEPLREGLNFFKSSIEHRNIVAHWQWALTEGDTGLAFNSMKSKPDEPEAGRAYDIVELKTTAFRLAKAATLINTVSITMYEVRRQILAYPGWEPNSYSNRTAIDEWIITFSLDKTRDHLDRIEKALYRSVQPPSNDKDQ
ncbi:hypothetical protein [Pseudomonas orientalis]|uniref:Uncharacterized protein n=1 Tax=Pseudomonas orientalis TaxID=76758 RepID=A0A4V2DY04_9PSED|nr:hypothetical protein [Pseudomonas orientalis]RZI32370.1 hypothetical protein EUX57_07555 [Pseudomonas orientalis]